MARRYHQGRRDRMDERREMKKYYKKYPSEESRAGHRYNESKKHRQREAAGMERYWHERKDRGGHAHKEKHREVRHNEPRRYGSSNHGSGSVSEYHRSYGPYTMDDHRKDPGYEGERINAIKVAQYQEGWGCGCGNAMRQHENGSMDYLSDKNEIREVDDKRTSDQMLPQ